MLSISLAHEIWPLACKWHGAVDHLWGPSQQPLGETAKLNFAFQTCTSVIAVEDDGEDGDPFSFQLILSPVFPTGARAILEMMEAMEIS